jgi:hypothetical protein
MATELYREAIAVPFMSRFIVYSKRYDLNEAKLRVYCITDDKEEKALELRENFITVAKSKEVEVLENRIQWLEMGGNIVPITKSNGEQLCMNFMAFYENRLPFSVRIKDLDQAPPQGRLVFLKDAKNSTTSKSDIRSPPVCTLDIQLPPYNKEAIEYDEQKKRTTIERGIQFSFLNGSGTLSLSSTGLGGARSTNVLDEQQQQNNFAPSLARIEFNLRLLANDLNNSEKQPPFNWINMAQKLELTVDEIDTIKHSSSGSPNLLSASQANLTYDMLTYWTNKYNKYESVDFNQPAHSSGEILLRVMRELDVDEDIINRNLKSTSFSNSNLNNQQQQQQVAENALSVEKSLAKLNLNLHDLLDANNQEPVSTTATETTVTRTIIHEDRDLIKVS